MKKQGLQLDRVVLLGRTCDEYTRYFALNMEQWRGKKILDVASGVGSFRAEAGAMGYDVTAADRIYDISADELAPRCKTDLDHIVDSVRDLNVYRWDNFYGTPERLRGLRERAYKTFLQDYRQQPERYVRVELPRLPFCDREFDLTLLSYLLFVYEDQFNYEFHKEAIRELMRVTRGEARIYPTVSFEAKPSKYLAKLGEDLPEFHVEVIDTDFEFLRNSNNFLRITHC
jgi:ubiquinone/menaquinone biosynthesis C-methylase UbiE